MKTLAIAFTLLTSIAFGQEVSGVVIDRESGKPLADAHVVIIDSPLGVVTDSEGKFTIESPDSSFRIRISSIGYITSELTITPDGDELKISLEPSVILLNNTVTVTAHRSERLEHNVIESVTTVSSSQLEQRSPRSTPEALMNETGVWVQKTNHGGGSPIIRGLVGNQVLLLVDGIRMNNATYRYGPNQYLSTIDPGLIEQIEVTRGSGSVLYGSDALGGVVQVVSKKPPFSENGLRTGANVMSRWMSDGMEKSVRTELELRHSRVAVMGGFSARNFGDILAGGDLGRLVPTGYYERSADAKLLLRTGASGLLTSAFQHLTQSSVPRFDQVTQGGFVLYNFDPQTRQLSYLRWESGSPIPWVKSMRLTGSLNRSIEGTKSQKNNSADLRQQYDEVNSIGFTAEVLLGARNFWQGQSGIEYYLDRVKSNSALINEITGNEQILRGSYADGSTSGSLALFSTHQLTWEKIQLSGGARLNRVSVAVADTTFGDQKLDPTALVVNLGMRYTLHRALHAMLSMNTGFRAPNIDDMSKFGTSEASVFEIPANSLSPEKTMNIEGGFKFISPKLSWTATAYRTRLTDLIDRVATTYNGVDMIAGRNVYQKQNVGEAVVKGVEAASEISISKSLAFAGNFTYTHGENVTKKEPMRRIPPFFGRVGVHYRHASGLWMRGEWAMAGRQDRLAAGDKSDVRISLRLIDNASPSWDIVNVYAGMSHRLLSIQVTGQNLLNKAYRVHGSGIDGYGRSVGMAVSLKF